MSLNPPSKRKAASSNSTKLPNPNPNLSAAASRKRAKTYDARSLAVQSADAALSATGELDVSAYVDSREFEIRSLESGMQRSKSALTTRAFQKVPRSLRRRTASHNVKRVPKRLRGRAKREMAEDNTPTVTARRRKPTQLMRIRLETARRLQGLNAKTKSKRAASKTKRDSSNKNGETNDQHAFEIAPRVPKIKKNKLSRPPRPEFKFQKRQRGKTWLPTHIFHAKRAHMSTFKDPLWRFALPLSPTEKSYRPSHRARGARGAVAWDMSYMSTIQLEGTEMALEAVLRAVGVDGEDAWGVKGRKWRAGTRSFDTWAFEKKKQDNDEKRPIAPVTLIWRASPEPEDVEMVDVGNGAIDSSAQQKKAKKHRERVFVRVHPSAFLQLWNNLLEVSKQQNPPVMVEDLRFEIGSIDITGPGATEALIATLQPITKEDHDGKEKESFATRTESPEATWSSLLGVTNPSSLPQNALLAFSVSDPRLHFPPRRLQVPNDDTHMNDLAMLLSSWPPDKTQSSPALFDRPARLAAVRQLPSQKAINRRRTLAGPGKYPTPQPTDPQIPLMLLAHRTGSHSQKPGNSSRNNNNLPGTWTILLPWKCVLPVWYSLMYYPLSSGSNPRFGGLKEHQQLAFEAGEPWFPGDFPGTRAGWEWNQREREESNKEWERRPKGRRVEFDSLDLGNGQKGEVGMGWACDWERLVRGVTEGEEKGSNREKKGKTKTKEKEIADIGTAVKPDEQQEIGIEEPIPPLNIHHLSSTIADNILNIHTQSPNDSIIDSIRTRPALTTVKFSLLNRGTPTPRARVYRLPTNDPILYQKWLNLAPIPQTKNQKKSQTQVQRRNNHKGQQQQQQQQQTPSTITQDERLLVESLFSSYDEHRDGADHLPSPTEEDLIGFVTTGNYNLSEGKGTGIGSILLWKVLVQGHGEDGSDGKGKGVASRNKMRMCIIRGSGERVGRLGVWDVV